MKLAYALAVLSVFLAATNAQYKPAPCREDACWTVKCIQYTNETCPDGVIIPNGGYCGCCNACRTKIPPGGDCSELITSSNAPTSACAPGTECKEHCHKGWICQ